MATLEQDVLKLQDTLSSLPEPAARPCLILLSGLPGTGKSYFSRHLAERVSLLVLSTDVLRRALFPQPSYSSAESDRLFQAVHELVARLLSQGIPIILDATNLVERHREVIYHIAERTGAQLLIVRTQAASQEAQQRLEERFQDKPREDSSEADLAVYKRMRPAVQQIRRNHLVVDTTQDIEPVLQRVVREIRRGNRV